MRGLTRATATLLICGVCSGRASGDDWPQWLGPQRDSVWRETGIVKVFPAAGLKIKWCAPVAGGYAGPTVANGRVYVTDYVCAAGDSTNNPTRRSKLQGRERVLCLSARDGSVIWRHAYDCPYDISFPAGPRVAPTVTDGKVYTVGAMGSLCCLDADSGQVLWSKDLADDYKMEVPLWGFAGHPLVDDRKLICIVGGSGSVAVALDKDTGAEIWRSLSAPEPGYCSPTIVNGGGRRQLIIWHVETINGLDPETGNVYWSVPLRPSFRMSIATPRQHGNALFATGVRSAALLLELDRTQPQVSIAWRGDTRTALYSANSTPFIEDNVIYGMCVQGQLRAVDLGTGKRLWETFAVLPGSRGARYGTAFIVKHKNGFFLFNESGDLILARLSPKGYEEISRFHLLAPTNNATGRNVVWSHPAFANKSVYARNDKELICASLAAE